MPLRLLIVVHCVCGYSSPARARPVRNHNAWAAVYRSVDNGYIDTVAYLTGSARSSPIHRLLGSRDMCSCLKYSHLSYPRHSHTIVSLDNRRHLRQTQLPVQAEHSLLIIVHHLCQQLHQMTSEKTRLDFFRTRYLEQA